LDVVDQRGEGFFEGRGEAAFELFRVEAGVLPGDGDDGDVDVGKDVRGGTQDEDRRSDQDEDREDNKGIRPVESEPDNPHVAVSVNTMCP
jgi:hypothetical protein